MALSSRPTIDQVQGRLLQLAALFLIAYALILSLSPAARAQSWQADYLWSHWAGVSVWLLVFFVVHRQTVQRLPERDPYLLPVAALMSGWGMLTIWRLYPVFGVRQAVWQLVAGGLLTLGLRLPRDLRFLRRYKYLWLTGGLLLTALTLIFGTNPLGYGPRMWLGCCSIYLQPSEPLKFLLIVYLAAYLADRLVITTLTKRQARLAPLLPLLAPTLLMTGLALLLLVVQRDLGTATIFIFLYTVIVYLASGDRRVVLMGGLTVALAGVCGYFLFDVVRVRIDAWINPWLDPSGRSYQIVQSLLDIANGGLLGRGPGLGYPALVPVAHSDFIFAAIAEETGLLGMLVILVLLAVFAERGLRVALHAPDPFRRYLAAGLTSYLVAQSILIIGGNLRLLPLTGVTLPFISYGGSSLVTSYLSLLFLLVISDQRSPRPASLPATQPYLQVGGLFFSGLAVAALVAGWWAIYRSPALLTRSDNPRRAIADRFVKRGSILDRRNTPIDLTTGSPGDFIRQSTYPALSPIIGYSSPVYGQSGLEASMDPTLRGLQGNPGLSVWWNHTLYGQPPAGLDIRTSLNLDWQQVADEQLGQATGAVVLLNAKSGEVLAMASHPGFDANQLEVNWDALIQDPNAPLINRATQGLYPPGPALGALLLAGLENQPPALAPPANLIYRMDNMDLQCSRLPVVTSWLGELSSGCPAVAAALGQALGAEKLLALYQTLGLYQAPDLRLPTASSPQPSRIGDPAQGALGQDLQVSPLQMALAYATLSAAGIRPAPSFVTAVDTPQAGWVIMPPLGAAQPAISPSAANAVAAGLAVEGQDVWQTTASAPNGLDENDQAKMVTWSLAGTLPGWEGTPLVVVTLIEGDKPELANRIAQAVLGTALAP